MANDKLTINLQTTVRPQSMVLTGVKRPTYLTSRSAQFVALARDASPSMSGQKAADATTASTELIEELAKPENKDGFTVAIVDFADDAVTISPASRAADVSGQVAAINTGQGSG